MKSCMICDDHVLVREALAGTVRLGWPAAVITEVGDFTAAWAEAARGHAMCIVDLMMPGAGPIEGVKGIRAAAPAMPLLVVTGTQDDSLLLDLLDLGISGFTPKTASGAIIEAALRLICAGGRYLPPRLAEIAASRIDTGAAKPVRDAGASASATLTTSGGLTDRQLSVLRLVATGLSNKEVAQSLDLSPATVKTHLAVIQAVLHAKNRTDAAQRARILNLL